MSSHQQTHRVRIALAAKHHVLHKLFVVVCALDCVNLLHDVCPHSKRLRPRPHFNVPHECLERATEFSSGQLLHLHSTVNMPQPQPQFSFPLPASGRYDSAKRVAEVYNMECRVYDEFGEKRVGLWPKFVY